MRSVHQCLWATQQQVCCAVNRQCTPRRQAAAARDSNIFPQGRLAWNALSSALSPTCDPLDVSATPWGGPCVKSTSTCTQPCVPVSYQHCSSGLPSAISLLHVCTLVQLCIEGTAGIPLVRVAARAPSVPLRLPHPPAGRRQRTWASTGTQTHGGSLPPPPCTQWRPRQYGERRTACKRASCACVWRNNAATETTTTSGWASRAAHA